MCLSAEHSQRASRRAQKALQASAPPGIRFVGALGAQRLDVAFQGGLQPGEPLRQLLVPLPLGRDLHDGIARSLHL